jgi:hypothetical protein
MCKLHGLRILDPAIFGHLPLSSADTTNVSRNIGIDQAWRGTYSPPTKEARATVMRSRIESHNAPPWLYEQQNFPQEYIQALMGHADEKLTKHYQEGHDEKKIKYLEVGAELAF